MPLPIVLVVAVLGAVAAVVGIPAGALALLQWWRARVPAILSWKKIQVGVKQIIERLYQDNFVPDLVIAIGRSGAIFGGLIAGNMRNLPMALLDRHFEWDESRRSYVPSHFTEVHVTPDCHKILVVVGEVYSGQSFTESLHELEDALRGKKVKTATLCKSKAAAVQVDYFVYAVDKVVRPAWVISENYLRHDAIQSKN